MQTSPEGMAELAAAQERTHYPIGGLFFPRIKYGSEAFDWHADTIPCHDGAAVKGQFHTPGCDVEECPNCHQQALSCNCDLGDSCPGPDVIPSAIN
jgi:hypothetical protein